MKLMDTPDAVTGPINLGNPVEFTMLQFAKLVIDLTGSSSQIVHQPLPHDDPKQRSPDISKAKSLLDWEPTVSLKVGLLKTIRYLEETLSSPSIVPSNLPPMSEEDRDVLSLAKL
jgi:UDP-glucuronate decarboxylase